MSIATILSRRSLLALLAAGGLPLHARPAEDTEAALRAAIDGPQRSAANRTRDPARHPFETLRFFGVLPTHSVVEIAPGGGWYTEILAPYLREHGHLFAAHYAADDANAGRRRSRAAFQAKLAANPAVDDREVLGTLPDASNLEESGDSAAGTADVVLTFRNVHNWIEDGRLDAMLHAFHRILAPGGVLGVVDHRAAPGTALDRIRRSGYVTEALMQERAAAAGFILQARSETNANLRDNHDHPNGVWSLPPTLRGGNADRERFLAIGESDRFTHRYVRG
jgi:predicted methyltransferase